MRLCASAIALLALVSATGVTGLQRVLGFDDQIARAERVARVAGRIDTEVSPGSCAGRLREGSGT